MKASSPRIVVVGSMVMDLVFRARYRPRPGETLLGDEFAMYLGGKGFNQAICCHRLGVETTFVGRAGNDRFGDMFIAKFALEGMDARFVARDPAAGTGVASPLILPNGANSIVCMPRANMQLSVEEVEAAHAEIARADVLMLQFEVNPKASRRAAEIALQNNTRVLLDPAPAHMSGMAPDWPVDYLVPNEVEANLIAEGESPEEWAKVMFTSDRRAVVISLGDKGALALDADGLRRFPSYRVDVKDTTGAGDAFRAGLAAKLARDSGLDDAVRYANACGALACTIPGAEPSMPNTDAVRAFMARSAPAGQQ